MTRSKRPRYATPRGIFLSISGSIFFGVPRRSLASDATKLLDSHHPRPIITGTEYIPKSGGFMFVANHYQREQLWIGWVGALLIEAVNSVRPARSPLRIIVTDSQRVKVFGRDVTMPFSRYFLGRIAHIWEMIPMPAEPRATAGHARALKTSLSLLQQGRPVLFFPEGDRGTAYGLSEALPGTGTFIALASRRAAILPCGLWEDGDQLCGQIAPPLTIAATDDSAIRAQVMATIGQLLPR